MDDHGWPCSNHWDPCCNRCCIAFESCHEMHHIMWPCGEFGFSWFTTSWGDVGPGPGKNCNQNGHPIRTTEWQDIITRSHGVKAKIFLASEIVKPFLIVWKAQKLWSLSLFIVINKRCRKDPQTLSSCVSCWCPTYIICLNSKILFTRLWVFAKAMTIARCTSTSVDTRPWLACMIGAKSMGHLPAKSQHTTRVTRVKPLASRILEGKGIDFRTVD